MFTYNKDTKQILRDDEIIGAFVDGVASLLEDAPPVVKGQIKKAIGEEVTKWKKVDSLVMNPETTVVSPVEAISATNEENLPSSDDAPLDIPPCPTADPRWGDKTPEVVEWYRNHDPEEYARRYEGRQTHLSA